jgi:predicted nucleotidyltransferase
VESKSQGGKEFVERLKPESNMVQVEIPQVKVSEFCQNWKIAELALFGSVLRDDFRPDSDVDVLVTFASDTHWSLLDLVKMEEELRAILGRKVDLVERSAIEHSQNYIRRRHILGSAEPVYVAR